MSLQLTLLVSLEMKRLEGLVIIVVSILRNTIADLTYIKCLCLKQTIICDTFESSTFCSID